MDGNSAKEKSKLHIYMELRGVTNASLARMTHIPTSTLSRIINNEVKTIKMSYMETIAKALNTSVYSLFDLPNLNTPLSSALRPEEAGIQITKILSEDESLLLYLYQTSSLEGRVKIMNMAKQESFSAQREIFNRADMAMDRNRDSQHVSRSNPEQKSEYVQLSLLTQKTP